MTPAGEIVQVDFFKSIIHSVAGLTYNEAQLMLDDPNIHDTKAEGVRQLNRLAKIFRKRRMDAGALTLASPEVCYCVHAVQRSIPGNALRNNIPGVYIIRGSRLFIRLRTQKASSFMADLSVKIL